MTRAPGFAMVGALLAILLVALFGTTMTDVGRTEAILARNGARFAAALAALDECTAVATRSLPLGWEFADALAGPDGVAGTGDDGTLSAPPWCTATGSSLAGPSPRILADIDAARAGGRRAGRAVVGRARLPGPSALLWLDDATAAGRVVGTAVFDGAVPGGAAIASIAAPDDPPMLDAWIAAQGGAVVVSAPTSEPLWSPPPAPAATVAAARAAGAAPPAAALAPLPPAAPQLALAEGDLDIAGARWAAGILVVAGRLRVATGASLTLEGLLVVESGIDVAAGGALDVRGAVWSGTGLPGALDVAGTLRLAASPAALAQAATLLTLPHEPRLLGWLDR